MSKEDRDNILDQHKELYNGYVMQNQTNSNQQPLYVQDFANDKNGINLDINGNVKTYRNFGINESRGLDMIGDGDVDLKNGTVDFEDVMSHNDDYDFGMGYPEHDSYENNMMVSGDYDDNDETVYVSLGEMRKDMIGDGDDDLEHGTYGKNDKMFKSDSFNDTLFDDEEWSDDEDEEEDYGNMRSRFFDDEDREDDFDVKFKTKFDRDVEEFYESDELGSELPLDDDSLQSLTESVNKSLDMFRRFKKY
jgi:hypothetical protein